MVSHAIGPGCALPDAHSARAIVLPAPGGPVTVVTAFWVPSAISLSIRGRETSQLGTPGTVILDVRSGSPAPAVCRAVLVGAGIAALVAMWSPSRIGEPLTASAAPRPRRHSAG